jgi:hypothetical protein
MCPDRHFFVRELDAASEEDAASVGGVLKFRILNVESPVLYWATVQVLLQAAKASLSFVNFSFRRGVCTKNIKIS